MNEDGITCALVVALKRFDCIVLILLFIAYCTSHTEHVSEQDNLIYNGPVWFAGRIHMLFRCIKRRDALIVLMFFDASKGLMIVSC